MNTEKELFKLAREYVMLMKLYEKAMLNNDDFKEYMDKVRNTVLESGYDVDKFVEYQNLYQKMTTEEYYEFIKTLD